MKVAVVAFFANVIIILQRPQYYDDTVGMKGETCARLAKNNLGKLSTARMKAVLSLQQFESV